MSIATKDKAVRITVYTLICDKCGCSMGYQKTITTVWRQSRKKAVDAGKSKGWELQGDRHYCPACAEERGNWKKETYGV